VVVVNKYIRLNTIPVVLGNLALVCESVI
jgi:hypothetical protein